MGFLSLLRFVPIVAVLIFNKLNVVMILIVLLKHICLINV